MTNLNNNPGNLKLCKSYFFVGEKRQSTDLPYRQFYEIDFGYRAMFIQLGMFGLCAINTIQTIINRWSGGTKEITQPYINFVCQRLNKQANEKLDMSDKDTLIQLVSAISQYENKNPANMPDVLKGYELLITTQLK